MSLLEKFSKVEVKADERISTEDRRFCEAHQSAYDDARSSLQELKFYWETMLESQKQHLSSIGETNTGVSHTAPTPSDLRWSRRCVIPSMSP